MFYETRNINKQPSGMSFKKDLTSVTFFLSRDFSHWTRFSWFLFFACWVLVYLREML